MDADHRRWVGANQETFDAHPRLVELALQSAMEAEAIAPQPIIPLAHVLVGALDECALCVARAADPAAAREECAAIIDRILSSFTAKPD